MSRSTRVASCSTLALAEIHGIAPFAAGPNHLALPATGLTHRPLLLSINENDYQL